MTTYRGSFAYGVFLVGTIDEDLGETFELTPDRAERVRRFGEGFAWGYRGTGPHCLALALLLDVLGAFPEAVRTAEQLYEAFAMAFVSTWPERSSWEITSTRILDWVDSQTNRRAEAC